jgi:hypothetical protein
MADPLSALRKADRIGPATGADWVPPSEFENQQPNPILAIASLLGLDDAAGAASPGHLPGVVWAGGGEGEPMLKSIGKKLSELLDTVFTPTERGTGLPQKLRFTNWDARKGNMQFHGGTAAAPQFEATPGQVDKLISGGALDVAQPPQGAVDKLQRILTEQMEAHATDLRNPTQSSAVAETKTPMRRTLDTFPKKPR